MKKKQVISISILLTLTIMLSLIVFLPRQEITLTQNVCNHVDANVDMRCDKCDSILPIADYLEPQKLEASSEDNTVAKISGSMPKNTSAEISKIENIDAINLAQKYTNAAAEDIVAAYDISLNNTSTGILNKYQPGDYNKSVKVELSNVEIDLAKEYAMLHILGNNNYELLPIEKLSRNRIAFNATSFSTYILITVEGHDVTFTGENYKVYDLKGNEITNGMTIASGTNFTFTIKPNDGYGVTNVTATNLTSEDMFDVTGSIKLKTANITAISQDLTIDIITVTGPSIVTDPVSTKVEIGESATFSVVAENATTYNWQTQSINETGWTDIVVDETNNANTATLTIVVTEDLSGQKYRCLVGNENFTGDARLASDEVSLFITEGIVTEEIVVLGEGETLLPKLIKAPVSLKIKLGEIATFTVEGKNVTTYKWEYKTSSESDTWLSVDSTLGTSKEVATGFDTATLTIDTSKLILDEETLEISDDLSGYVFRCLLGNDIYPDTFTESDGAFLTIAQDEIILDDIVIKDESSGDSDIGDDDKEVIIDAYKLNDQTINVTGTFIYNGQPQNAIVEIHGKVKGEDYTLVEGKDYTVAYTNNINAGTAIVTITGSGDYSGEVMQNYEIGKKEITITPIAGDKIYGEADPEIKFNTSGVIEGQTPGFTGNLSRVDGNNVGEYEITLGDLALADNASGNFLANNYSMKLSETPVKFTINVKNVEVDWGETNLKYNGTAQAPTATVLSGVDGETIELEISGAATNVGSYTAIATIKSVADGNGESTNYNLTNAQTTFTISSDTSMVFNIELVDGISSFEYDGTNHEPAITVKVGDKVLSEDTGNGGDYTVSYKDNKNVGTATIEVKGVGNYADIQNSKLFTITPRTLTVTPNNGLSKVFGADDPNLTYTYSGNVIENNELGTLTEVPGFKGTLTRAEGKAVGANYLISLGTLELVDSTAGNFESDNYVLKLSETPVYFEIVAKSITTLDAELYETEFIYTGEEKKPTAIIVDGEYTLIPGTDYTITYDNNINVGENTAVAIITGSGNYTGEIRLYFTIKSSTIDNITAKGYAGTYDGLEHGITVTAESANISYGTTKGEYGLTQSPVYKDAGSYTVYFKVEKENYEPYENEATVIIEKRQVSVSWSETTLYYDGTEKAPSATVVSGIENEKINLNILGAQTEIGTYTATAEIKDVENGLETNYELNKNTTSFTITVDTRIKFEVTKPEGTFTYNGFAHTPDINVTFNGASVTQGNDYILDYGNNVDAGEVTIQVIGQGEFENVVGETTFTILPIDLVIIPDEGQSKKENEEDPELTFTYVGNITSNQNGLEETPKFTGSLSREEGEDEGTYPITLGNLKLIDNELQNFKATNYVLKLSETVVEFEIIHEKYETGSGDKEIIVKENEISDQTITVTGDFIYNGQEQKATVEITGTTSEGEYTLIEGTDYTLDYDDPVNAGTVTITITGIGKYQGTTTETYEIARATITVTPDEGQSKKTNEADPELTYTYSGNVNGETPKFTGSLSREAGKNVGLYPITLGNLALVDNSEGNFLANNYNIKLSETVVNFEIIFEEYETGSGDKEVIVEEYDISKQTITVTGDFIYNGQEQKATVEITGTTSEGEYTLIEGTDYTLDYDDPVNAGTVTITITGIGKYQGTTTETYEIGKKAVTVTPDEGQNKNYGDEDPEIKFTHSGIIDGQTPKFTGSLTRAQGEEEGQYLIGLGDLSLADNTDGNFLADNYELKLSNTAVYFEIIQNGLGTANVTLKVTEFEYDGQFKEPKAVVILDNVTLLEGIDYEISYENNKDAGTATAIIKAIEGSRYCGEISVEFTIIPRTLTIIPDEGQSKKENEEDPELTYTYINNVDGETPAFTGNLSREDGRNAGMYLITLGNLALVDNSEENFLANNYNIKLSETEVEFEIIHEEEETGSGDKEVIVEEYDISKQTITITGDFIYNGQEQKATVEITGTTSEGEYTLIEGTDYTLDYDDPVNAGTVTITISGTGNYSGDVIRTYEIDKKNMTVTPVEDQNKAYGDNDPEIKYVYSGVIDGEKPAFEGGLSRTEGENAGTYTITLGDLSLVNNTAENFLASNYNLILNETPVNFTIDPREVAVEWTNTTLEYNGNAQKPTATAQGKLGDIIVLEVTGEQTNVGTYTATASIKEVTGGNGKVTNYTLTNTQTTFTIVSDTSIVFDVTLTDGVNNFVYDGTYHTPEVTVKVEEKLLELTKDYTVSYEANKNVGTATIKVTGTGNYAGIIGFINFTITPRTLTVLPDSDLSKVFGEQDPELTFTYSGNVIANNELGTVTEIPGFSGSLTRAEGDAKGKYLISLGTLNLVDNEDENFLANNYTLEFSDTMVYFEIETKDLSGATAELKETEFVYDGQAKEPKAIVTLDNVTLVDGTDYTISYENNTEAGTATAIIKATENGNYESEIRLTFTIKPATLEITSSGYEGAYDGNEHGIKVTSEGATITYGESEDTCNLATSPTYKDVGTYTVYYKVERANYETETGSQTVKITQRAVSVVWDKLSFTYNGNEQIPIATVNSGVTNETINLSISGAAINVGTHKATATIKNVTAIDTGVELSKDNYKLINDEQDFIIIAKTDANFEVTLSGDSFEYDGTAHTPNVTVTADGKLLEKDLDYEVEYIDNVDAGTATVIITGIRNYVGEETIEFTITKRNLVILPDSNQSKQFGEVDPTLTFTATGSVGTEEPKYSGVLGRVSGEEAGEYAITLGTLSLVDDTASGFKAKNYNIVLSDTLVNFTIKPKQVTDFEVTLSGDKLVYDGNEKQPGVKVVVDGVELEKDKDYTVSYENNTDATDEAKVIITGIGNYAGEEIVEFTIEARELIIIPDSGLSKKEGEDDPELTFGYTNNLTGETPKFSGSLSREPGEEIGEYAITLGDLSVIDNQEGNFKATNYKVVLSDATVIFEITDKDAGEDDREVIVTSLGIGNQNIKVTGTFIYNGQEQKADVVITGVFNGNDYTLVEGKDYTLEYKDNINAGTATVIIKGIGAYSGEAEATYEIGKKKITITPLEDQSKTYGEVDPEIKFTHSGVINGETAAFTGGLTKQPGENVGSYEILLGDLAPIDNPDGNFLASNYELTLNENPVLLDIVEKELVVEWDNLTLTYNGMPQAPTASVETGVTGEEIVLDVIGAQTNVGEYLAEVEFVSVEGGNGLRENYILKGTTATFNIVSNPNLVFTVEMVSGDTSYVYNGEERCPEVIVKVGDTILKETVDYTVTYTDNIDVGTATITVNGTANYEGAKGTKTFQITERELLITPVSGQNKVLNEVDPVLEFTYSGHVGGEIPRFTGSLTRASGEAVGEYLISLGDLSLINNLPNNFKAKNYTLVFSDEEVYFTIKARDISNANVSLNPDTFVYTGNPCEPGVVVEVDGITLTLGTDYTVRFENNVEVGTATAIIEAATGGNYVGRIEKTFTITEATLDVESTGYTGVYDGKEHGITVTADDSTITYGTEFGTYDRDISPVYKDVGTYTVYFKVEKANYETYTGTETITITQKIVSVIWDKVAFIFDGTIQTPTGTVESGITNETINLNVIGGQVNVGTYTAKAEIASVTATDTGTTLNKENYKLINETVEFTIVANGDVDFTVLPAHDSFEYDGTYHEPDVVVKHGDTELVEGKDYTVQYSNNKDVGAGKITITGKGNYLGSSGEAGFMITKRMLTILPDSDQSKLYGTLDPVLTYTYYGNVDGEIPQFTGELTRDVGEDIGEYIIRLGTLTVLGSDTFKLANYNFRISEVEIPFTILPRDLSNGVLVVNPTEFTYDGTAKEPATVVRVDGTILTRNVDYIVEYDNNVNVGIATARAIGIGNYKDILTANFTIKPISMADGTLTLNPTTFEYDGTRKTPDTTVIVNGRTLIRDKDYVVTYFNNIEIGDNTASAVATGIGNYSGELTANFSITSVELKGEVVLGRDEYVYDKTEKRPTVTVVLSSGAVLVNGTDYTVAYENNIDAGTATVIITGNGIYQGELRKEFIIKKATINLVLEDKNALYTGSEISIGEATVENAYDDLTSYITYKYYDSYSSETPIDDLPVAIGIYYAEAMIIGHNNYEDTISERARLVIYGAPSAPSIMGRNEDGLVPSGSSIKDELEVLIYGSEISGTEDVEFGYKYSFDGNTWVEYTEPIEITTEGTTTIYAKAYLKDNPNVESEVTKYVVTIDNTDPVVDDIIVEELPDSVVIEVEVSGDGLDEIYITEDPTDDPTVPGHSGDWKEIGDSSDDDEPGSGEPDDDDNKTIFELTQGDEEKTIYVWVKDAAGNIVGPFEKKITLSALKVGNKEDNKTTIKFKVTDLYLHTSDIKPENLVIYVNDTISNGTVTELTYIEIAGGYEYTAIVEDITGDGEISIGLNGGIVFDKAGNNLSPTTKVPTNEMTADNTVPNVQVTAQENTVYIIASDENMKAVMVNGKIIGRTNGTYEYELKAGINKIEVIDEYGNEVVQEILVEEEIANSSSIPNSPKLKDGMTAVYWVDGVEYERDFFLHGEDYDYTKPSTSSDNTESKWANAKTLDGSYWVWIPRYAYKVTYYTDSSKETISETETEYRDFDVIFLKGKTNEYENEFGEITILPEGYKVAEAFGNNTTEGGWSNNLEGFWISKYEMSCEESADNKVWVETANTLGGGNQTTTNAGNSDEYIRAVSKPNVPAWTGINVSTAYQNAYNMYRTYDSHLVKNSEWEATFILAESEYGRNGNFVELDLDAECGGTLETSTTGNITGVFDLLGGVWEYTATYIPSDTLSLTDFASALVNEINVQYKQEITETDIENMVFSDIENAVFDQTMLKNPYLTSLVVCRGGDSKSVAMDAESIPVAGSPDSRVGYRAAMTCVE